MENFNLIEHVVPSGGWYCAVGIPPGKNQKVIHKWTKDKEELQTVFDTFASQGKHVYFGLAKYKENTKRTADNVESLQSLWVDIDCGEGKANAIEQSTGLPEGYATQAEGLRALASFTKTLGLPRPTLVDSGNGVHAYWAFTEEVPKEQWIPVAKRFKEVCVTQKFCADPRVFEVARILRVPGTLNVKYDTPSKVTVKHVAAAIPFSELRDVLGVDEDAVEIPKTAKNLSWEERVFAEDHTTSFKAIITRENPCKQLVDCIKNRKTLAEPRWFNALSIAKHCNDSDKAVHALSKGHPDYDPDMVQRKIKGIKGPHGCDKFAEHNLAGCEGCVHKGSITSPIQLGKEPELFEEEEEEKDTKKPPYPKNYYKAKSGGIWFHNLEDENSTGPKLVYPYDFYVEKRMWDPGESSYQAVFKLHSPRDGLREFVIKLSKVTDERQLKALLSENGILAPKKQFTLITQYIMDCIIELSKRKEAEIMRTQFGWADNHTKFIVGTREITVDGVYHSPASSVTEDLVDYFEPAGTLDKWKEVFNLYDREGLEVQAFAALSGFGAPLLQFTGQKGAIINLVHKDSGTGKTTVLRMANSICGDPELLLGTPRDTAVAKITKLGLLNNIVNTMDELSNMPAEQLTDFAYATSQGRGNDKGDPHANKLRKNNTTWRTISLTSSNSSFYDKLQGLKDHPDGEIMRIIEFVVEPLDGEIVSPEEGKEMFDHQLGENYGHAIVPFIQYVIANFEDCMELIKEVQGTIDKKLKLTSRERNWSAMLSANIAGGIIARKVGLINLDIGRIYKKVIPVIQTTRKDTTPPVDTASATIGEFLNLYNQHLLIINNSVDKRAARSTSPILEPRMGLLLRYEPDTKLMYITANALKKYCNNNHVGYRALIKELKAKKMCLADANKQLTKGTNAVAPPVRCNVFDCSHSDFINMDAFAEKAKEDNATGEGELPDQLEEV